MCLCVCACSLAVCGSRKHKVNIRTDVKKENVFFTRSTQWCSQAEEALGLSAQPLCVVLSCPRVSALVPSDTSATSCSPKTRKSGLLMALKCLQVWMGVCRVVCLLMSAPWWTGNSSRVYPPAQTMSAGIGSDPLWPCIRVSEKKDACFIRTLDTVCSWSTEISCTCLTSWGLQENTVVCLNNELAVFVIAPACVNMGCHVTIILPQHMRVCTARGLAYWPWNSGLSSHQFTAVIAYTSHIVSLVFHSYDLVFIL